jgi:hypothetical protein
MDNLFHSTVRKVYIYKNNNNRTVQISRVDVRVIILGSVRGLLD